MRLRSLLFVPGDSLRKYLRGAARAQCLFAAAAADVAPIGLDGQMFDIPHRKASRRVLDAAGEAA